MPVKDTSASLFPLHEDSLQRFPLSPLFQREYLLDGELVPWNGPMKEVHSPIWVGAQRKLLGGFPLMGEKESLCALEAAVRAFDHGRGQWPTLSVEERIQHVERFVYKMVEKRSEVVNLLMWEIGKSLSDSEKEFDRTVQYIIDTVNALKDLDRVSSRFSIEEGIIGQIRRAPLGVVLSMGPFNYPLNETFTTLLPALIMGNTVVFKPPKLGVLLFGHLLKAFQESFPRGVVNSVYGQGSQIIPPMMTTGKIDVLAFIGSSEVADGLKKLHPMPHRLRSVLGLGAKNPAIVLADADLGTAVRETVSGSLSFNGQRCTALKIIFVDRKISEDFVRRLCLAVAELKMGMPWENAFITPLPEPGKPEHLKGLIEDAQQKGALVTNPGGGEIDRSFFSPAVLFPVSSEMTIYREEQFGPIIPVVPFDDIEEPVRYMIESNYGQQLSIFGENPEVISSLIDRLVNQVCRVNINSQCQRGPDIFPFTGRKDSAEGTLSVSDALRVFSIRTLVAAKANAQNKHLISTITRERKSKFLSTDFIF